MRDAAGRRGPFPRRPTHQHTAAGAATGTGTASRHPSPLVIQRHGTDIGWGCLRQRSAGEVEIDSFGLLPALIGRGCGGHALTLLARQAWARMAVPSGAGLL